MVFRPATPGFLVTLIATILLAVVSFNVPILKSIFFLKASITIDNFHGTITLGTLGYCLELNNGTTCSKPSIGYQFDPNALLQNNIEFAQVPEVIVKWITYALFLHVVALIGAAISAVFGLLAHVREMSMTCCSSCVSGLAAFITMVAFIFDLVLFFVIRARVRALEGGEASFGNAIWMTLAAWLLLFFSGCFYAFGRCCINRRPRGSHDDNYESGGGNGGRGAVNGGNKWWGGNNNDSYAEQMRLDAVKAEAERKARQQRGEIGLPAMPEHDATKPLKSTPQYLEEEDEEPYRDNYAIANGPRRQASQPSPGGYAGGYARAAPGTRAVDEYYTPTRQASMGYPPSPQKQYPPSNPQSPAPRSNSQYAASTYSGVSTQYGAAAAGGHSQHPSGREYGHTAGGTTYHSAATAHQQHPSNYLQTDPYAQQPTQQTLDPDTYNNTGAIGGLGYGSNNIPQTASPPPMHNYGQSYSDPQGPGYYASANPASQQMPQHQPQRSYTLGGGGYDDANTYAAYGTGAYATNTAAASGFQNPHDNYTKTQAQDSYAYGGATGQSTGQYGSTLAPYHDPLQRPESTATSASFYSQPSTQQHQQQASSTQYNAMPMPSSGSNAAIGAAALATPSGPRGPREPNPTTMPTVGETVYEDSPPSYEAGPSQPAGVWGEKR